MSKKTSHAFQLTLRALLSQHHYILSHLLASIGDIPQTQCFVCRGNCQAILAYEADGIHFVSVNVEAQHLLHRKKNSRLLIIFAIFMTTPTNPSKSTVQKSYDSLLAYWIYICLTLTYRHHCRSPCIPCQSQSCRSSQHHPHCHTPCDGHHLTQLHKSSPENNHKKKLNQSLFSWFIHSGNFTQIKIVCFVLR